MFGTSGFILIFLALFDWDRAYLATYPRSGNHWMRYLVEEATHIATSSVYCDSDPPHLHRPFPWGGYCCENGYEGMCRYPDKDETALVKTHFPAHPKREYDELPYRIAIRIVRNPIPALYSYYEYEHSRMRDQKILAIPHNWVVSAVEKWKSFDSYWNKQRDVYTLRYEDLQANPKEELRKVLLLLNYPFREIDLNRAVGRHPPKLSGKKWLHHFTESDLEYIQTELKEFMKQYHYDS